MAFCTHDHDKTCENCQPGSQRQDGAADQAVKAGTDKLISGIVGLGVFIAFIYFWATPTQHSMNEGMRQLDAIQRTQLEDCLHKPVVTDFDKKMFVATCSQFRNDYPVIDGLIKQYRGY
jgi:hypothetical protein